MHKIVNTTNELGEALKGLDKALRQMNAEAFPWMRDEEEEICVDDEDLKELTNELIKQIKDR